MGGEIFKLVPTPAPPSVPALAGPARAALALALAAAAGTTLARISRRRAQPMP